MISMLAFATLASVVVRLCASHSLRVFVLVTALAISVLIGMSRIYLGVHWPSDVAAGWCLGMSWACASWLVMHYLEYYHGRTTGKLGHSRI